MTRLMRFCTLENEGPRGCNAGAFADLQGMAYQLPYPNKSKVAAAPSLGNGGAMRTDPPAELSAAHHSIQHYLRIAAILRSQSELLEEHKYHQLLASSKRRVHLSPAVKRVRQWAGAPPAALPVALCSYTWGQ